MLYDISINPPIISVLVIIFMICMEMLLAIYGDSDFEKLIEDEEYSYYDDNIDDVFFEKL